MVDHRNSIVQLNDHPHSPVQDSDVNDQAEALVGLISQMMSSMNQETILSCQN